MKVGFLRIDDYERSESAINFFYTNAPFSVLFVILLILGCVYIAIRRTRSKKWLKSEREKILIEFGVPIFCVAVVVAMSYEQESLTGTIESPNLVRSERWLLRVFHPTVTQIPVAKIRSIRIHSANWQNTRNGSPDGPEVTTYFIRLDVGDKRVPLLVGNSRDRELTSQIGQKLADFIQLHPDHQPRGFHRLL